MDWDNDTNAPPRLRTRTIVIAYAVLFVAALVWCEIAGRSLFDQRTDVNFVLGIAVAVGGAVVVVGLSSLADRLPWISDLSAEFRTLLAPMTDAEIAAAAFASGVAEEAFFRGAMQPDLGLVPTSMIFGLLHIGPSRKFLWWTATALVVGFLLGLHAEWSGNIAGAALAHFTVNYFNLHLIMREKPSRG